MPSLRRQGGAVQAYRLGNIYPNFAERSPPILWVIYPQFCWLFTPNFVGYLPPIVWVIYPQFCWLFTSNCVGNLPHFVGNLPQVWDSLLTPNFGNWG